MVRWVLAAAFGLAGLGGCSAVIGPAPDPGDLIACDVIDGIDPCPAGSVCRDGWCMAGCVPMTETCNNEDDDCDGRVDNDASTACGEGEVCQDGSCRPFCLNDEDMDGFAPCGTPADCNDAEREVYPADPVRMLPGPPELCDGIDNDCNAATTETSVCTGGRLCVVPFGESSPRCVVPDCNTVRVCGAGTSCNPTTGNCDPTVTDCRPPTPTATCSAAERCDPLSGLCVTRRPLGADCGRDIECDSLRCVPRRALALRDNGPMGMSVCADACGDEADCPVGFSCWAAGTGVRVCVQDSELEADRPVLCSDVEDCGGDDCTVLGLTTPLDTSTGAWICGTAPGGSVRDTTDTCDTADCAEGLCISPLYYCSLPCETSADCGYPLPLATELTLIGTSGLRCGYRDLPPEGGFVGARMQACVRPTGGSGGGGVACAGDADCIDGFCRAGRCSAICARDEHCPGGLCTPIDRSGGTSPRGWEMRCVPLPPELM